MFKDPSHLGCNLGAILKVYPNARFVWIHRNITDVVGSFLKGAAATNKLHDWVPESAIYALAADLQQGYAFRTKGRYEEQDLRGVSRTNCSALPATSQEDRFQDVFLEDLIEDPVAELQKLYKHWGMEMSSDHIQLVNAWATGKTKRSPFSYPKHQHMDTIVKVMPYISSYFERFPRSSPKNVIILPRTTDAVDEEMMRTMSQAFIGSSSNE